jgi:hypothetical protein
VAAIIPQRGVGDNTAPARGYGHGTIEPIVTLILNAFSWTPYLLVNINNYITFIIKAYITDIIKYICVNIIAEYAIFFYCLLKPF